MKEGEWERDNSETIGAASAGAGLAKTNAS